MDRRTLLRGTAGAIALAVGSSALGPRTFARKTTPVPDLASLGLPEVTIAVDDKGFTAPTGTTAGRVLMTVENRGSKPLHFFAARVPDEVSDAQLAADLAAPDTEPAWFDMAKLTFLGTPDWPAPGGRAQGVVDVTAGRWVLTDPIDGRAVSLWTVGEGATGASEPEPAADVEVGLVEMDFTGLDAPIPAGPRIWKITNRGAMEHELALLPVPAGSTKDGIVQTISNMLQGKGDEGFWTPVGGQGIASKGVTSWQRFDLGPDTYAGVCMSPMPGDDFKPHALMGMVEVFTVE